MALCGRLHLHLEGKNHTIKIYRKSINFEDPSNRWSGAHDQNFWLVGNFRPNSIAPSEISGGGPLIDDLGPPKIFQISKKRIFPPKVLFGRNLKNFRRAQIVDQGPPTEISDESMILGLKLPTSQKFQSWAPDQRFEGFSKFMLFR